MNQEKVIPLLESVVQDNPTYPFPIDTIRYELLELLNNQLELQYFLIQADRKLKRDHHKIFANIFLTTFQLIFEEDKGEIDELPYDLYQSRIERLTTLLENMKITRVEKDSPDGEMLSAMK
jgi:hypothetical protein